MTKDGQIADLLATQIHEGSMTQARMLDFERIRTQQSMEKHSREKEENHLNLFSYLRRRYPHLMELDVKNFEELIMLKNDLEGPKVLRQTNFDIAMVRRR